MKRNYYVVLLILLSACSLREQSEIQKDVLAADADEVIQISADSLVSSFEKDSAAAADLYVGKVVSVKGEVLVFENMDTVNVHPNDSLPGIVKWFVKRLESDFNASNIVFAKKVVSKQMPPYVVNATFPKEYRNEIKDIKEKDNVHLKGLLEHVSTVYAGDSTNRKPVSYIISIHGCVIEK